MWRSRSDRTRRERPAPGETYEVDRLLHVGRQAATKIGGCGMCYEVMVCGKQTKMWEDEGRWFMEAKH